MARTLDECKAIYDTYNQSEKSTLLLYATKCMTRSISKGMQMIHSGLIGDVVGMRCHWFRNADWRRPVPHRNWSAKSIGDYIKPVRAD